MAKKLFVLFTIPQFVAIVIKRHIMWHSGEVMKAPKQKPVDVRFRLEKTFHELLVKEAKKEERSMNYLMNKAVEKFLNQESAKA